MAKFVFTKFNRRSEGDIEAVAEDEDEDAVLLVVLVLWLLVEKDIFVACNCAVEVAAVVVVGDEVVVDEVADICLVSADKLLACAKIEHLRFELKGNEEEDITTIIRNSGKVKLLRRLVVVDFDFDEGDIIIELKLLVIVLRLYNFFFFFLISKLDLNISR